MRPFLFMIRSFWTERSVYFLMLVVVLLVLWLLSVYVDFELADVAVRQGLGGV